MLTIVANLASCSSSSPTDKANVYANLDAVGNAGGELAATPINARPVELFPGFNAELEKYAQSAYLRVPYLRPDLSDKLGMRVEVGPVHFGRLKVAAVAIDANGNEQAGAAAETEMTVNSTPRPATDFRRSTYTDGRQWFTFIESPQLKV